MDDDKTPKRGTIREDGERQRVPLVLYHKWGYGTWGMQQMGTPFPPTCERKSFFEKITSKRPAKGSSGPNPKKRGKAHELQVKAATADLTMASVWTDEDNDLFQSDCSLVMNEE